jgi:2-hydroxychromene-2-carboxylate isomerase
MPTVDFFYEFASTYSYIAAMRIAPLANGAGVTLRWRPFLLGPIFKAQGWDTSPFNLYPAKGRYMVRDCERQCADLGLSFRLPEPFPQNSLLAARVALAGLDEGWGEDFSRAVYRAEFAEGRNIGEPAVIADIVRALGQDSAAALARAQSDDIKGRLRANTEDAQRLGIFGAPSFVAGGELFWGNDRLEQALDLGRRA